MIVFIKAATTDLALRTPSYRFETNVRSRSFRAVCFQDEGNQTGGPQLVLVIRR